MKPVAVFDHPHGKEMFPKAQSEPFLAQLCANPRHPAVGDQGAEPGTFLCASPQGAAGSSEATPRPPSVQTGQPSVLSLPSQDRPRSPFDSFLPSSGHFQVP